MFTNNDNLLFIPICVLMIIITSTPASGALDAPKFPELVYSSYFGGSQQDYGYDLASDGSGGVWVAGTTQSPDFPVTNGAYKEGIGGNSDVFISHFSSTGILLYSTYLGGNGSDGGSAIADDGSGGVWVAGTTQSPDFPVTNGAYKEGIGGNSDVFISHFSSTGILLYSTYLGGTGSENGFAIVADGAGGVWVTGTAQSPDFPVTNGAYQAGIGGNNDAFISHFSSAGILLYSTYLGGTGLDDGSAIADDGVGGVWVAGTTRSPDFPVTNSAYQAGLGGNNDVFISHISSTGVLLFSTYVGGFDQDYGRAIVADGAGGVWIAGGTKSPDFPVTNSAYQAGLGGSDDAFISHFSSTGILLYSTYFGGITIHTGPGLDDLLSGITVDSSGGVWVIGRTPSLNFPVTDGAFQINIVGSHDAFISHFSSQGVLLYSTYLGGSDDETGYTIGADGAGGVWISGFTESPDFPVTGSAYKNSSGGGWDAFIARFSQSSGEPVITSLNPPSITAGSNGFTLTVTGTKFVDGAKVLWDGQERSTEFVSSTKLTAVISKADAAVEGNYPISIVNLDGSYSNEFKFRVLSNTEASGQEAIINRAVKWAKTKEGSRSYEDASMTYCLGFVKDAYMGGAEAPMSLKFDQYYQSAPDQCAKTAFNYLNEAGKIHQGIPLKGAWVFYDVNAAGYSNYGHVGIAIDDLGNILNVQRGGVREDNYLFPGSSVFTYIGWAYPPLASPIPVSPSGGASVNPDDVTFSWENLDWANIGEQPDYYELYISEQPYGESNIIFRSSDYGDGKITTTSFEYPDDIPESQKLKAGTLYRWNVRAQYPTYGWDKPAAKSYFTTGDEVGSEIPVADFTISPESLKTYNDIILDGSKSKTAEGSKLIDFIWRIDNGRFLHSYSPQFYTKISTPGFHDISLTVVDDNGRTSQPKIYQVEVKPDPNFKWWVQLSGPEKTSNYETKHYTINITNQVPEKNIGPVVVKLTYSPEYEIIEQSEDAKYFYIDNKRPLNQKYSISINNGASKSENEAYSQNAYWIIDKVWYPGSKLITFEIQLKQKLSTTPDLFLDVEVNEISQLSTNALYPGISWTPENVENNKAGKDRLAKATDLDATLIKCLFETNDPTKLPEGFNGLPFDIRGAAHTWFASNGIYTPENYVENSEGDKHYNIVFSHSGGTQVLYQKMKNKKVTADYAFFVAPALISQDQMEDLIDSGAVKKKIFIIQSTQDVLYNAHVLDFQKKYDFSWNPFTTDIHPGLNVEVAGTPLDDIFKPFAGAAKLHKKWNYIDVDPLLLTEGIDKEQLPDQSSFWIGGSNRDYQELFYKTYVTPEHDYAINIINVEYTNKHPWLNPYDEIEVHGYLLDWLIEQYNLGKIYPFDGSIPDLIKPSLPGEQHAIKKIDYATAHDPNTKIGPEGHYPSDQPINYRVEYENEGDGSAFGVYITDVLDPSLDESTLEISPVFSTATGQQIAQSGIYDSVNRTIRWVIGEVGPSEGGFANISVKFSPSVPDDTKVMNYATVYFPSAFEETQTNAIVTIKGVNFQPDVPNLTYPDNNYIDLPVNGTLFWQCHDPNNETLVYDVYLGTSTTPPLVLENTTLDMFYYSGCLNEAIYYWKVVAKDPYDGITSSEIHQFTIISNTLPPIANFTFDATFGQFPLSIQYIDNSTGNITSRLWSFGDGTYAENVTEVTHIYSHSGNYTVNLTVIGPDGEDSASQVIQILPPQFTLFGNATLNGNPAPIGTVVTASAIGYNTTFTTTIPGQYGESEIGKGLVLAGDIPNDTPVTFTIGGLPARCGIVNEDGTTWSDSYPFSTNSLIHLDLDVPATIVADFSGTPTTGYVPLEVLFTDNSTTDPFEKVWDFGDGTTSTTNLNEINHTYTIPGTYTVSLEAMRASATDTELKTGYITVSVRPLPPIADFTASPLKGIVPLKVTFSDTSTGDPDSYLWNFGDGSKSSDQNPVHTYSTQGMYSVTLTVENDGGNNSVQKSKYIIVEGPVKALPGLKKMPRDLNGDGRYEDLDGNGKLNANDVILLARHLQWIQRNEPGSAFDFNNDGKFDFRDFYALSLYVVNSRR